MKKSALLAAVSFAGLIAASSAFADSNTVYLNQTGNQNIAVGLQDSGSVGNALNLTQSGNQYANAYQAGGNNTINSNQSNGYNFVGAPSGSYASPFGPVSVNDVNSFLAGAGVQFTVNAGPFAQSGNYNTLNNSQTGRAGLIQGSQSGSNSTISNTQVNDANALSVNQGGGNANAINSYQGGFEIATLSQNGSNNSISGSQTGGGFAGVNSAVVSQDGSYHQANYNQNGGVGNSIALTQSGIGNISNLTQSGSMNSASITQR